MDTKERENSYTLETRPRMIEDDGSLKLELGAWAVDAACADMDGKLFFPSTFREEGPHFRQKITNAAKAVCSACPVQEECLDFALENHEDLLGGIFGGYTHQERTRILRHRNTG